MFELATDFSKRTVYPEFLDIDPKWDYEESQKHATRYIKETIENVISETDFEIPFNVSELKTFLGYK